MTRNKTLFQENIPNLLYINNLKSYFIFLRAEYIFTDCDLYDVNPGLSYQPGKFNVINLWHGDPIKAIGYISQAKESKGKGGFSKVIFKNYFGNIVKLGCSSSLFFQKILNTGHLTEKYKITGLPRNDIFFRNDLEIFNIKENLHFDNYKKIFLYVPTWRQDSYEIKPFSKNFIEILNSSCEENNFLFVIKSHQNSDSILYKNYSNIIDISKGNLDSQEVMKYSDCMITDYSSIFIDFMLLDKPIFFYAYDYENYKNNLVNLVDDYENCVIKKGICYNEKDLLSYIKNIENIFKDKNYKQNFHNLKNLYHKYQNGGYCEKILELIKK
ncbi:CDP-glycerol glycerophosphotransferase family protein [Candidatus Gracilibacteria bacterium]|nr:CDP-glycerol glycerophosphotransferase family protein [Candidatus Gracilibacteria bacterium]